MKTVHFHGVFEEMAKVKEYKFQVATPLELINALNSQVNGFAKYVSEHQIVLVASNEERTEFKAVHQNGFSDAFSELEHIHIAPIVQGSGIETALIAAGLSAAAAATVITVAVNLAVSFVVSQVIKALAPSPDSSGGSQETAKRPSFLYNGAKLVSEQGLPIPLIYGTHIHGGFNIGTDIDVVDIPYVPAPAPITGDAASQRGDQLPPETYQWGNE